MKVFVRVMPKEEVSDPKGEAILEASHSLGFQGVKAVRAGQCFMLEVEEDVSEERIRELSDKLLVNPMVEDFLVLKSDV